MPVRSGDRNGTYKQSLPYCSEIRVASVDFRWGGRGCDQRRICSRRVNCRLCKICYFLPNASILARLSLQSCSSLSIWLFRRAGPEIWPRHMMAHRRDGLCLLMPFFAFQPAAESQYDVDNIPVLSTPLYDLCITPRVVSRWP